MPSTQDESSWWASKIHVLQHLQSLALIWRRESSIHCLCMFSSPQSSELQEGFWNFPSSLLTFTSQSSLLSENLLPTLLWETGEKGNNDNDEEAKLILNPLLPGIIPRQHGWEGKLQQLPFGARVVVFVYSSHICRICRKSCDSCVEKLDSAALRVTLVVIA